MEIAMEMAQTLLSAENARTLLLMVSMLGGFIWLKSSFKMDELQSSLSRDMDEKIKANNAEFYYLLKTNDFKHLNDTIEALTYALEKNRILTSEDKAFIDSRLDKTVPPRCKPSSQRGES